MDNNDNDVQDAGDMGLAGQTVWLLEVGVGVVGTTTTDADGNYLFEDLEAGNYFVRFDGNNVDGKTLVESNVGTDDTIDSDIDNTGTAGNHNTAVITLGEGENVRDVDAGVEDPGTAAIEGTVFMDNNDNSVEDAGDMVVSGVQVELLDANGDVIATATTDGSGNYRFDGLDAGDYSVRFPTTVDGKELVSSNVGGDDTIDSDADEGTGETGTITLGIGDVSSNNDAGIEDPGTGSLAGVVFMDNNDNSVEDAGDMRIANVTVELLNDAGDVIATATTNGNGEYLFDNLNAGDYSVRFPTNLDGKTLVDSNVGGNDDIDSDANTGTGETGTVNVGIGENVTDVDAGVEDPGTASIGNLVFLDNDGNGVFNAGDDRVDGVTVELLDENGDVIDTTTTNANGNYLFDNLDAGVYSVRFTAPDGTEFTTEGAAADDATNNDSDADLVTGETDQVTLDIGEAERDVDAGLVLSDTGDAAIEGTVFMDNNDNDVQDAGDMVISGVQVELLDDNGDVIATATTDGSGNYRFDGLDAGDYSVRFPTDVDGKLLVDANQGGDDTVDSDANQGTGETGTISLDIGEVSSNNDAGVRDPGTASLAGVVFMDNNDNSVEDAGDMRIANVAVELLDENGAVVGNTTTNGNGEYEFTNLDAGDYTVRFPTDVNGKVLVDSNAGGDDTIDSDADQGTGETQTVSLGIGERIEDLDAGVEDPAGSAIEGTVFMDNNDNSVQDAGDMAVAGVTVELLDDNGDVIATATTDGSGNYRFDGLEAGDYSVRFPTDVDGKVLVDANQGGDDTVDSDANQGTGETGTITLGINETSSNNDAGVEDPGTASLGDKVFIDTNGNGQQDAGEAGLDGVDVTLFDADGNVAGQTTTQNGGMYLFSGLAAGTYSVGFAEADGFDFTTANQGNDASDSDADQVTGLTGDYTLAIGEENLTVDAGVVAENGAPNPVDDTAMTCADDEVTVNVLSNDSDPDGDALAITEVDGQAITEGGSVTTGAGTVVTLQGGQLVINGEAAYAGLDIGESAVEAISYTISDGVDSSTADVNVTFKGDANDYDSLADSLPATGTFEVTGALANPDAFTLELSNTGDARFDGAVFDQAYCLSFFDPIPLDQGVAGDVTGADNAGVFEADQISGFNGETAADNLDLIQYIVAQNHEGNGTYDGWDVQFAIWELTDNIDTDDFTGIYTEATVANVDAILADAAANGEGFSFGGDGNNVGAIIDPNPQTPGVIEQPFIIGFNFDNYDCIC
jgi:protocatechuate 3,4-dioxygenase beta subunit